jgi:hypothetical protein
MVIGSFGILGSASLLMKVLVANARFLYVYNYSLFLRQKIIYVAVLICANKIKSMPLPKGMIYTKLNSTTHLTHDQHR